MKFKKVGLGVWHSDNGRYMVSKCLSNQPEDRKSGLFMLMHRGGGLIDKYRTLKACVSKAQEYEDERNGRPILRQLARRGSMSIMEFRQALSEIVA